MSLASLVAIPEMELRAGAVRERLLRSDAAVVGELDRLIAAAAAGQSSDVYLACALALAREAGLAARLATLAADASQPWAGTFLADAAPSRALHARGRLPDAHVAARTVRVTRMEDRLRTGGAYPRLPTDEGRFREHLDHDVITHPSPIVVRRLLASPTTHTGDVVRVATRRPTTPALVEIVATSARWMAQLEVRDALVKNPFTPTRLALLYLPTLRRTSWTDLAGVSRVHGLVRAGARSLLRGRIE